LISLIHELDCDRMTVPAEYERASAKFHAFLIDVRDQSGLWSTHVTYTMVQGVLQVFRRRLTTRQAIAFAFANVLPIGLRALFVTEWDPDEPVRPFESLEMLNQEVRELRAEHNFSIDSAIQCVAGVLRNYVDREAFGRVLQGLPNEARAFWAIEEDEP